MARLRSFCWLMVIQFRFQPSCAPSQPKSLRDDLVADRSCDFSRPPAGKLEKGVALYAPWPALAVAADVGLSLLSHVSANGRCPG